MALRTDPPPHFRNSTQYCNGVSEEHPQRRAHKRVTRVLCGVGGRGYRVARLAPTFRLINDWTVGGIQDVIWRICIISRSI
jgi:hypothetical protein